MATRGRKPTSTAVEAAADALPPSTLEVITHDLQQADAYSAALANVQENITALAKELTYEGALTVESLEEEIKFYQRRSVEAVLEMGKRLLLLKEVAGRGFFMDRLEGLGIGQSLANKLMAATLKFSNSESTTILALPNLNQGKLLELLVLDDGEIEALNSGDQVRGIQLDDVDCMSVSELRRALRQEQADKEAGIAQAKAAVSGELAAKDKLLADRARRISELVEEKNKRECLTVDEQATEIERALVNDTLYAVGALLPIRQGIYRGRALDDCPQGLYVAMQGALDRILGEVLGIASDFGIQLNFNQADDFLDNPNEGEQIVGFPSELDA